VTRIELQDANLGLFEYFSLSQVVSLGLYSAGFGRGGLGRQVGFVSLKKKILI